MKQYLARIWAKDMSVREDSYYEQLIPHVPFKAEIPLSIHQTYRTYELPDKLAQGVEALKRMNPDCAYRLWNDADCEQFVQEHYGDTIYRDYYQRIGVDYGAARADLFRYLLIYLEGGLYLDIKSSLGQPLRELIGDSTHTHTHTRRRLTLPTGTMA